MARQPLTQAKRLEKLRWPLIAFLVLDCLLIGRASWNRIDRAVARSGIRSGDVAKTKNPDALSEAQSPISPGEATVAEESQPQDSPPQQSLTSAEVSAEVQPTDAAPQTTEAPTPADELVSQCVLSNPAQNGVRVGFLVNDEVFWLSPGESQSFPCASAWLAQWSIVFHRGGDLGDQHQTLSPGCYRFVASPDGWTLVPDSAYVVDPSFVETPSGSSSAGANPVQADQAFPQD